MKLNPETVKHAKREVYKRSLPEFVRAAWPHVIPDEYQPNWHIDAICDHLQAVADGEFNRLLINVPPGASKSTLVNIMYPAWLWGPRGQPQHRFISAAHEQGLAVRDNRIMRELVLSEWYQDLWPLALKGDQNEKLYFENEARGFRQASAVVSITGRRGHTVVWDDPLSPEKASSDTQRETAIRIFNETLPLRLNDPKTSAIIVVMQRLHEQDVSGHILANDFGYVHLCIPMEYEPERHCHTCLPWDDPRTEEGELMFPARFPREVVDRDKAVLGSYGTAGQFQQRPAPRGGGIFKDEWWRYHKAQPLLEWRGIYVDTAQKTKTQNDWSVFQCWGRSKEGQAICLDIARGKWEAPELLSQARAFWNKHKALTDHTTGRLRHMKVEDKVSGTTLIQTLAREGIPVLGIQRNIDKITRAYDAAPLVESGNVSLPENAPWLADLMAETRAFPNAAHDDMVDPLMDAVTDICAGRAYTLANL